jgi:hypothetical protein
MMISKTLLRQYIREIFLEANRPGMTASEFSKPVSKHGRPNRFKIMLDKILGPESSPGVRTGSSDQFTISVRKEGGVNGDIYPEEFIQGIILPDDPHNQEIITKIQNLALIPGSEQERRETGAKALQQMVKQQGIKVQVMEGPPGLGPIEFVKSLGQFTKTGKDDLTPHQKIGFKSQGTGGSKSLGIISEERVVEDINLALQGVGNFSTNLPSEHPLTVVFLDKNGKNNVTLKDVVSASGAGTQMKGGVTSKSDVDITYDGGKREVGISMKMVNAGHWLSADMSFQLLSPLLQALEGSGIAVEEGGVAKMIPSSESAGVEMVVEKNGQKIPANFTVPDEYLGPEFMEHAVFGSGVNRADLVLKGDYYHDEAVGEWDPTTKTLTIRGSVYASLADLLPSEKPTVIITGSAGRPKRYLSPPEGDQASTPVKHIRGLRFQIVIADRAKKAVVLDLNRAVNPNDVTIANVEMSPQGQESGFVMYDKIRESLLREFVREMILLGVDR